MGTKYLCPEALDGGLTYIKTTATKMILVSSYALLDSYATVQSRKLAEATMTSTDYTIAGADGAARTITTAAKTVTATAAAGAGDLQVVFTDGVSKVIWVVDETSNQAVTIGMSIPFPTITHTSNQPA